MSRIAQLLGLPLAALCACATPRSHESDAVVGVAEAALHDQARGSDLRARVTELESSLAKERELRNAVEAREREWITERRELLGRILEISLERVRLERELIAARIEHLENELGVGDDPRPAAGAATNPSPTLREATRTSDDHTLDRIRLPRR